jgi:putative flippase GtrA
MQTTTPSVSRQSRLRLPALPLEGSLVSFLAIGGTAALGFMLLTGLAVELPLKAPDWLVSAVCYAVFIVPVYLLHRRFSFRSGAPHHVALPRYLLVQLVALLLAAIFSFIAYGVLGLPWAGASVFVIFLTSGVNFAVLRLWAFAAQRQPV